MSGICDSEYCACGRENLPGRLPAKLAGGASRAVFDNAILMLCQGAEIDVMRSAPLRPASEN